MEYSLKNFFEVSARWGLTPEQERLIIGVSDKDEVGKLDEPTPEQIKYILNIYKALHTLFPKNPDLADRWIHTPNRNVVFENNPPIELLKRDLAGARAVYGYLAGQLSSPFS